MQRFTTRYRFFFTIRLHWGTMEELDVGRGEQLYWKWRVLSSFKVCNYKKTRKWDREGDSERGGAEGRKGEANE